MRNTHLTIGGDSCGRDILWVEINLMSTTGTEAMDHALTAYLRSDLGLR